ncbi:hypothetical protein ACOSP7_007681 [Xanthoceras sorbifolium]
MTKAAAVVLLLLLTTLALLLSTSAQPPPPGCVNELVAFSPCLSYVSAPPNNVTETAASQCCGAVSSVLDSGDGNCLCYLLRQPLIFSFPLNQTRVASLSLVCNTSRSLESICFSALPPSTTDPEISKPSDSTEQAKHNHNATRYNYSAGPDNVQAPSISSPPPPPARNSPATFSFLPGNSVRSPTTPSSSVQLSRGYSFPTPQIFNCSLFLPGLMIFPLVFIHL